jgi:hypothetical protein
VFHPAFYGDSDNPALSVREQAEEQTDAQDEAENFGREIHSDLSGPSREIMPQVLRGTNS